MVTGLLRSICMFSKTKLFLSVFLFVFIFLFFPNKAYAVTVNITNFPATISSGDAFQVGVSITGAEDGNNYLRADLYKDGTSNYFGETFNGSYWLNSGNGLNYYPIQIQNSTASASFLAKVGSPSNTDFPGTGSYKLRIRRYTASGNAAASDSGDPVTVNITYLFSTPTPTPSAISMPTPTPIPLATKTPTPTPVKTKTPSPKPTPTPQVLGEESTQPYPENPTAEPVPTTLPTTNKKTSIIVIASIFIGVGVILTIVAGVLIVKKIKSENPLG